MHRTLSQIESLELIALAFAICMALFWLDKRNKEKRALREARSAMPDRQALGDRPKTLRRDERIDGVLCLSGTRARFEDGRLSRATLGEAVQRQGALLPIGTPIELDGAGSGPERIVAARLLENTKVFGVELPAETELEFDRDGKISGAILGGKLAPGPGGMIWIKGAWIECAQGKWILDPLAR